MNKLCLIIPAYNEARRLPWDTFRQFALKHPEIYFLFVDDGSSDGTSAAIQQNFGAISNIALLTCTKNEGKASAVRQGMMYAVDRIPARHYGYTDADLSTPLEEMARLNILLENDPTRKIIFGSRILTAGSAIVRKSHRHYIGRIVATCISWQLGLAIYDTQCGAKIFQREVVPSLFKEAFITPWLFDVELFNRLIQQYDKKTALAAILEIPLQTWVDVAGSKIGWKEAFTTPIDLIRIAWHYRKK